MSTTMIGPKIGRHPCGSISIASRPLLRICARGDFCVQQTMNTNMSIGHQGEGLPTWWRLGPSTRGCRSYVETLPIATSEDKRWLIVDIGIVAGLAMLCFAVGMIVS